MMMCMASGLDMPRDYKTIQLMKSQLLVKIQLFLPAAILRIAAWPVFEPGAHSVTFYVTFYNPQVNRVCQVRILYSENVSQLAPGDVTFSLSNIVDALPAISCV